MLCKVDCVLCSLLLLVSRMFILILTNEISKNTSTRERHMLLFLLLVLVLNLHAHVHNWIFLLCFRFYNTGSVAAEIIRIQILDSWIACKTKQSILVETLSYYWDLIDIWKFIMSLKRNIRNFRKYRRTYKYFGLTLLTTMKHGGTKVEKLWIEMKISLSSGLP